MNCSQGGGYSSNFDTKGWAINMRCDQIDMRLERMDYDFRKLKKTLSILEDRLQITDQHVEYLLQRVLVLETANLLREEK